MGIGITFLNYAKGRRFPNFLFSVIGRGILSGRGKMGKYEQRLCHFPQDCTILKRIFLILPHDWALLWVDNIISPPRPLIIWQYYVELSNRGVESGLGRIWPGSGSDLREKPETDPIRKKTDPYPKKPNPDSYIIGIDQGRVADRGEVCPDPTSKKKLKKDFFNIKNIFYIKYLSRDPFPEGLESIFVALSFGKRKKIRDRAFINVQLSKGSRKKSYLFSGQ